MGKVLQRMRKILPPPNPPLQLSGEWTREERQAVVARMYEGLMYTTQGRAKWIQEADWNRYKAMSEMVLKALPEIVALNWPTISRHYRIDWRGELSL